jgi:signal transduction histidine kinase
MLSATGRARPGLRRTISAVFALPAAGPAAPHLSRLASWIGLASFGVFLILGLVAEVGHAPARAVAGGLIAAAGAIPLFLFRTRFTLPLAAVATAGVVLLSDGTSRDLVWMTVVVLAAWCVLAGGIPVGIAYWVASLLLFGAEDLWVFPDPGWAPWLAGVTVTGFGAALIRHQLVLVERLRKAQADLAERSRAEERNRIARELHDVIAHSLTVSLLHVSSARLAVEHEPADAARALEEAERLGRQSLAEVRATIGLLRPATEHGIAPPVPGLDQVPRLVSQLRDTGADISLTIEGNASALPATTGSAVYRIVQEALTNATRHAPGAAVAVRIIASGGELEVSVDSGGPAGRGSGMGLTSMTERAQAVGGTCTAGPGGSGWLVSACLPMSGLGSPA